MSATDAMLLIAHPDDDAIFGGPLQVRLAMLRWQVVCLTYTAADERGQELLAWQASLGVPADRVTFLGFADDPADLVRNRSGFRVADVAEALLALPETPPLVVTHNAAGEYGHPHHRSVHRAAVQVFEQLVTFGAGSRRDSNCTIEVPDLTPRICRHYRSQATVVRSMHERFATGTTGTYRFP